MDYSQYFSTKKTSQLEPIPGTNQVQNNAGGFTWQLDDWARLNRFLILGSEQATYYCSEKKMTKDNANAVLRCIQADGPRVVQTTVQVSESGRAPKNDPAIFVLAMCAGLGDSKTKKAALDALPKVCRIGTHIFQFMQMYDAFGKWNRSLRTAISKWYNRDINHVAYQVIKYQQRAGYTHRDLLRLSHAQPSTTLHNNLFKWIVQNGREDGLTKDFHIAILNQLLNPDDPAQVVVPRIIAGFEQLRACDTVRDAISVIRDYKLPREAVENINTEWLQHPEMWEALLEDMPLTAMIRNLATMTRIGLLVPMGEHTKYVTQRLSNEEHLRKSRVHPIAVLSALMTYRTGHGVRGKHTWTPVTSIIDVLDVAFYKTFPNAPTTGKRILLSLDVSGSMNGGVIAGVPGLTPRVASAALALVIANTEPQHLIVGFTAGGDRLSWTRGAVIKELAISPRQRLDDVIRYMESLPFGGTDCSLPWIYAKQTKLPIDANITITDNETFAGLMHPHQALEQYRSAQNIPAKSIVMGMTATEFSIANPDDPGSLDVVGCDLAVPNLIADFIVK